MKNQGEIWHTTNLGGMKNMEHCIIRREKTED